MGLGKTITADRPAPAPARPRPGRRADAGGLPGLAARQLGDRDRAVRARRRRCAASTAPPATSTGSTDGFVLTTYGTMRRDAAGAGRRCRGTWSSPTRPSTSRTHRPRRAQGAAHDRRPGPGRADRHAGGEQPHRAVGDPRLDDPGLLGSRNAFRKVWAAPIESRPTSPARRGSSPQLVGPFLLRRRKSDPGIAPELPAKTETDHAARADPRAGRALRGAWSASRWSGSSAPTRTPAAGWC